VGFAEAARLASERLAATARRQAEQQAHLESGLRSLGAQIVGASCERLTSVTLAVFPGVVGELLVQALDLRGIAVSSGAACASGSAEPSPVLRAMGHAHPASAVRVSQGPHTTTDELDELLTALAELLPLLSDPELA
jgi:cysteine desulfurase